MSTDDGGSAFPRPIQGIPGMSLRDYFAAAVLPTAYKSAIIARQRTDITVPVSELTAAIAYKFADDMLAEREKKR